MNFKNIRDKIQHLLQSMTIDARDFITGITHVSRETLIVGIAGKGEWHFQTAIFGFPFVIS